MITVRFTNGQTIQYNSAYYVMSSSSGYTDLYTKKYGDWVAQVPTAMCVIEIVTPSRVYNELRESEHGQIARDIAAIKRRLPPRKKAKR